MVVYRLTEPSADLPALEGASAVDGGCLRLAAAASMLRLARRLDGRLTPSSYCALSLMMQDMLEEVRAQFTTKLMALVRYFQVRGRDNGQGWGWSQQLLVVMEMVNVMFGSC